MRHANNHVKEERLTRKINKGGWKRFLVAVQPADATLLREIAREKDGWESKASAFPCAAPSQHDDVRYTTTKEKCRVLTDYFQKKFRRRWELHEGRSNRIDTDGSRVPAPKPTSRAAGLRPTSGGFSLGRRPFRP